MTAMVFSEEKCVLGVVSYLNYALFLNKGVYECKRYPSL